MATKQKPTTKLIFYSPTVQAGWEKQSFRTDFENLGTLGKGSYGTVWKAKHKLTGKVYAIKEIKKKSIASMKMLQNIKNEVKIMYELNHPHIVKLYNHFEDEFSLYFILEFAEKGELYKALFQNQKQHYPESVASKFIYQIALALQQEPHQSIPNYLFIHSKGIIHRDIKPENILIGSNDEMKLADFGWSSFMEPNIKRQTYCGTLDYLAPEMVEETHLHDYRVDIWSLGVLTYQLCTGFSPFSYNDKQESLSEEQVKINIAQIAFFIPPTFSPFLKDLISKILRKEPDQRISIQEILKHPWIQQYNDSPQQEKENQYSQIWLSQLKKQFSEIKESKKEESEFSGEEIYKYSRVESIINMPQGEKVQPNSKDNRHLEIRIRQLEVRTRSQEEQINEFRRIAEEHKKCEGVISQLKEIIRNQNNKILLLEDQKAVNSPK